MGQKPELGANETQQPRPVLQEVDSRHIAEMSTATAELGGKGLAEMNVSPPEIEG